ncbi:MAG: peptide chain release factor 1 [Candidatus Marinimicrobia bacterium]|jgi:peptide chain release factor 1|nr:peptide chain release factor 1 [Candidatus Neomarinimicrobiota bacterium]MBP9005083.1 peptide chain release factor 1 [Candidatus Neomarinimicrobiota bacterium]HNZ36139.1 peptide chain release factor 1 [Candidatus Neomarinimicrobiota bacterium]HOD38144.1 peptide chain release factor 1 [Candidatus Neomarinimicrobiota bacterium]HOG75633.1 peptide chain release factor 1 [Candidatus Neomarinimicrobiota bacterium]
MREQIQTIIKRYNDITDEMSRPEVIADQHRYRELAKEHKDLTPIVDTGNHYLQVLKNIDDDKAILEGHDEDLKQLAHEELATLEEEKSRLFEELKKLLIPKDPNDDKNAIVEIRAGTGGEEAAIFAADLYRLYLKFAERKGWKVEELSGTQNGLGGFKEVIFLLSGENVYGTMKFESGVHRVQRVPVTETQGRIHTSAATVAVLPEAEEVDIEINASELRIDTYRSSGAGGQHVNKVETAIRITHLPTGLVVTCQDEKSQYKNKEKALKILRSRLLALKEAEKEAEIAAKRRSMVSTGDRSAKIRTYNFPQGRVTDHRINLTLYRLTEVMEGEIDELISALQLAHNTELMKS